MTYQTLYRKYRSQSLDELVGQRHIIQTLTNALSHDRLSHAYIFSGPRGTGKTSTARILAKMVNQTTEHVSDCEICKKISQGTCVDVIEIDAASHTGVDHMRQLTEQVQFLPIEATTKVFIIDEVHMLSTGAFNALLKTFEEPPKNILFILATTELHKIPATIQSRAQTLHFRLLDDASIRDHVLSVCQQEGVSIESSAADKLVQLANGGMRDALSLLDQLISVCDNNHITSSEVTQLLGTLDESECVKFLSQCFSGASASYQQLKTYIDSGMDVFQLYDDVIAFLHHALLIKEEHSFAISNAEVSDWLQWFCDQLVVLKDASSPGLSAQVGLYRKIHAMSNDESLSHRSVAGPSVDSASPLPQKPTLTVPSDVTIGSSEPRASSPKPMPSNDALSVPDEQRLPSEAPVAVVDSDANGVCDRVLQNLSNEFPVLKPVLSGATLMLSNDTLYLVLDETYRFFEKKLAEEKFKARFLTCYCEASGETITQWVVTSDVNVVHQAASSRVNTSDNAPDAAGVQSKTVNQIIEMFEAQVIE